MTDLTLFHSPNSCSEGIAFLLRRLGVPHRIEAVPLADKAHQTPEFLAKNPKGKVPALQRPDGSVLTEFTAIAFWLGKAHPEAGLLGDTLEDEARTLELLDFIVASLHMRGFTFIVVPQKFIADPTCHDALRAHGRAEVEKHLRTPAGYLGEKALLMGRLSIADAAAWYVLRWATAIDGVDVPAPLKALYTRLKALDD